MAGDVELPGNVESFQHKLCDLESKGCPVVCFYGLWHPKSRDDVVQSTQATTAVVFLEMENASIYLVKELTRVRR